MTDFDPGSLPYRLSPEEVLLRKQEREKKKRKAKEEAEALFHPEDHDARPA